jgi:5-methylcytosine-specific restriction endonuclease McrA
LCGLLVAGSDRDAHVDHIIHRGSAPPEITEALENLRLVCRSCHSKRHASE